MNEWEQLKYHAEQQRYWASVKRFNFLPCGRQSGKTELALRKLVRYLPVRKPWDDPRYFYAGPTYQQCKKVAWNRLLALIPNDWITGVSKVELTIKTTFGSELSLYGLDKPQRFEGQIIDGGVVDENSDIKPGTFDKSILPTLVWRDGWTDFIGVPKRFGIGAAEYRDKCDMAAAGTLPDSALFSWPSAGIVPPEYLELCRKTMDTRDFDEQFNASWLTAGGGVFHAFDRAYNVRHCDYHPELAILVGMDFNVTPMSWVLCHLSGDSLDVFDEVWLCDTNTPAALQTMLSRYQGHKGGWQIYGDATSQARKTSAYATDYQHIAGNQALKAMGMTLHIGKSNPPRADRFAVTNARICDGAGQRHIFIDKKCKHLITDLGARNYKPGSREPADSGDIGHPSDALGYICHYKWPLSLCILPSNIVVLRR